MQPDQTAFAASNTKCPVEILSRWRSFKHDAYDVAEGPPVLLSADRALAGDAGLVGGRDKSLRVIHFEASVLILEGSCPASGNVSCSRCPGTLGIIHIEEAGMAADGRRGGSIGGIGLGGILVIVGIVVAIVWSLWLGIIVALIGLIAFGGFAKGKWY
jgi:hypothetical protein